jgi:Dyp-type peroxidase family
VAGGSAVVTRGRGVESPVGELREPSSLRLGEIQGNVAPGFRKDHQAFVLVHFSDRPAGRHWLRSVRPSLTSAEDVATFVRVFKRLGGRRSARPVRIGRPAWVNLALTWDGLCLLGADDLDAFPDEFRGSRFQWSHSPWEGRPSPAGNEVHALLIVAADRAEDLERELARQRALLAAAPARELTTYRGQTLPDRLRGYEHFGFRDGIGQPRVAGIADDPPESGRRTMAGEFILGYPNERGEVPGGPSWSRDGSYLVFWRLRQHVASFRLAVRREGAGLGLTPEQLAARLVGRWPSGALPSSPIESWDPGLPADAQLDPSRSDYLHDPRGCRFALFAHIRKSNPRDRSPEDAERHRLLRRGIPYGPPLAPGRLVEDGQDRGLLFLAYQASIAEQFEYVQRHWLENPDFPAPGVGPDPLAPGPTGGCVRSLPRADGQGGDDLSLPRLVTPTTRGYFFAPSLEAIRELARPLSPPVQPRGVERMLDPNQPGDLVDALRQLIDQAVKQQLGEPRRAAGNGAYLLEGPGIVRTQAPETINPRDYAEGSARFDYSRFLHEHNPYGVESIEPTDDIEVIGPAQKHNIGYPLRKSLEDFSPLEVDECPRWTFGKATYRVTKAIRIPYRYKHPNADHEVEGSILIGFQGPAY